MLSQYTDDLTRSQCHYVIPAAQVDYANVNADYSDGQKEMRVKRVASSVQRRTGVNALLLLIRGDMEKERQRDTEKGRTGDTERIIRVSGNKARERFTRSITSFAVSLRSYSSFRKPELLNTVLSFGNLVLDIVSHTGILANTIKSEI